MIVMPLSHSGQYRLANDINTILSKIRRGCAMARQDSQNNPATNMMVDLPEGIDFEITAIYSHQNAGYARQTTTTNSGNTNESEANTESGTETGADIESGTEGNSATDTVSGSSSKSQGESGSESGSDSKSESGSESGSESDSRSESESGSISGSQSDSRSGSISESESESESGSESSSKSGSQSGSGSEKTSGKKEQAAAVGREVKSFEDETGSAGPQLALPQYTVPGGGTGCS
jgi:hypothetical protein